MTQPHASFPTRSRILSGLVVFALFCGTAIAGKSDDDDHNGKHKKKQKDKHSEVVRVVELPVGGYFVPQQQGVVTHYYVEHYKSGRCPPGLVKKGHKCKAPKFKKWKKGQPLPVSVVYYPVPQVLVQQIGPPPQGYRYVRVDNDLLLLATGTQMVIDAIENLLGQ